MKNRFIEVLLGSLVTIIAIVFLSYGAYVILKSEISVYHLKANFSNVGTLSEGTGVHINGVKVGKVSKIELDKETYNVIVTMVINSNIKIAEDSKVTIKSLGLLDGLSMHIIPSKNSNYAKDNAVLWNSEDWVSLEDKIGNIFFNSK